MTQLGGQPGDATQREREDSEIARICREYGDLDLRMAREWEQSLADGLDEVPAETVGE